MPAEWTETVRPFGAANRNSFGSDSTFPSKAMPTQRASRSITGLSLLPPVISLVETKLIGMLMSTDPRAASNAGASSHGISLSNSTARAYSP